MLHWNKFEHLSNICCTYSCIRHGLLKYFCCQAHHLGCLSQFWHYICHCIEQKKRTKRAKRVLCPYFKKEGFELQPRASKLEYVAEIILFLHSVFVLEFGAENWITFSTNHILCPFKQIDMNDPFHKMVCFVMLTHFRWIRIFEVDIGQISINWQNGTFCNAD